MDVFKPPHFPENFDKKSVFLAGSIEMGKAVDWQLIVEQKLADLDVTVYNPRRDDWNSEWEQSKDNVNFRGQVEWELDMLEKCDVIMMFLDNDTLSPISLMELGLFATTGKLIVCCPIGFYRKGNVDIVCERYDIPMASHLPELIEMTRDRLYTLSTLQSMDDIGFFSGEFFASLETEPLTISNDDYVAFMAAIDRGDHLDTSILPL